MKSRLTSTDRRILRAARKERRIIKEQSQYTGFEYVLVRAAPKKICFGSGTNRECLPTSGPAKASIMRRLVAEPKTFPGPGDYYVPPKLFKEYASRFGYGGLAKKALRTTTEPKNPPVGLYDLQRPRTVKEHAKPFGVGAKLKIKQSSEIPGPGTYKFMERKFNVNMEFGHRREITPAVKMICSSENFAKCEVCEKTPIGDYWHHFESNQSLCRPCMTSELDLAKSKIRAKIAKLRRLNELRSYARVRHCGFYHNHMNTVASIKLLPKKVIKMKIRTEDYLAMFGM